MKFVRSLLLFYQIIDVSQGFKAFDDVLCAKQLSQFDEALENRGQWALKCKFMHIFNTRVITKV